MHGLVPTTIFTLLPVLPVPATALLLGSAGHVGRAAHDPLKLRPQRLDGLELVSDLSPNPLLALLSGAVAWVSSITAMMLSRLRLSAFMLISTCSIASAISLRRWSRCCSK